MEETGFELLIYDHNMNLLDEDTKAVKETQKI
jgi:hypothetical protein